MAILAVARGRPVTRDRVVALLWPEADTDHARHLLADSIYVLRAALGRDVVTATGDDVSINSDCVSCDVAEFRRALDDGEHAQAVRIYTGGGPFLDGVHLSGVPEFERWVESVRERLTAEYRSALESLASDAAARGCYSESAAWWRQLAAEDPLSSRAALGLMRTLVEAGEVTSALEFARVHEQLVRTELETTPDPAVLRFAQELRRTETHPRARSTSDGARHGAQPVAMRTSSSLEQVETDPARSIATTAATAPTPLTDSRTTSPPWSALRRRPIGLLLIPLMAATLYVAVQRRHDATSSMPVPRMGATSPSLVVLPLVSIEGDSASQAFADRWTEEIIATVSRSRRLRVIASTSAFAFKGHRTDVRRIADSLQVSNVLEGALQRIGSRMRLTLRLIDAQSGTTRWSQTYDQEPIDLFAVEDSIGLAVTHELHARLVGDTSAPFVRHKTNNLAAYELYLRSRDPAAYRSDSSQRAAVNYLQRAIAKDSGFAAAYAELAFLYAVGGSWGRPSASLDEQREMFAKAEATAQKARDLDDSLSDAHTTLAFIRMRQYDLPTAAKELKRALALDPSDSFAHEFQAVLYWWTERPAAAVAEEGRAVLVDPLSAEANLELAHAFYFARRYAEAIAQIRKVAVAPPFRRAPLYLAEIDMGRGEWSSAITALRALPTSRVHARALLGYALGRVGERAEATTILSELIVRWKAGTSGAFDVATVCAGLGDLDEAFTWLDRAFEDRSLSFEIMAPLFDDLRADQRFELVRQRLRITEARKLSPES